MANSDSQEKVPVNILKQNVNFNRPKDYFRHRSMPYYFEGCEFESCEQTEALQQWHGSEILSDRESYTDSTASGMRSLYYFSSFRV